MKRRLVAATAAALTLGSGIAHAGATSAQTLINTFDVQVLDLSGNSSPSATADFTGNVAVESVWNSTPYNSGMYPGPPAWRGYETPLTFGDGPFGGITIGSEIDGGSPAFILGWVSSKPNIPPGMVWASAGDDFGIMSFLEYGGTGFTLSPYSEIVITTDFTMTADGDGASANALLRFTGADPSTWYQAVTSGNGSYSVIATFVNATDEPESGSFQGDFFARAPATSIPEPASAPLMALGLLLLTAIRRQRR